MPVRATSGKGGLSGVHMRAEHDDDPILEKVPSGHVTQVDSEVAASVVE